MSTWTWRTYAFAAAGTLVGAPIGVLLNRLLERAGI